MNSMEQKHYQLLKRWRELLQDKENNGEESRWRYGSLSGELADIEFSLQAFDNVMAAMAKDDQIPG